MSNCCDRKPGSPLELIPAGLSSLPRQLAAFPEIRQQLLERLANVDDAERRRALADWRPSGDDFGLMWLEMWAYVADVLGFYDERIANESYLGTAVRRPSLRRLVELLGYTPQSGVAATSKLAAIAEGRVSVTLPAGTGFRSRGFSGNAPEVFELALEAVIHPLTNQWKVEPYQRRPTVDSSNFVGDEGAGKKEGSNVNRVNRLLFEPSGFGLAESELVVIEAKQPGQPEFTAQPSRVTASEPFAGKDGRSYIRVSLEPPVVIEPDIDLHALRARRPTQTAVVTANAPIGSGKSTQPTLENVSGGTRVYFDKPPTTFRLGDPIIVARNFSGDEPAYVLVKVTSVKAAAVRITSIPERTIPVDGKPDLIVPSPAVPAAELIVAPALGSAFQNPAELTFHHGFVSGGSPTNTGKTVITADELSNPEGVPIHGTVELPLDDGDLDSQAAAQSSVTGQVLQQEFLLSDADDSGMLVDGKLTVGKDGHAFFQAVAREQIPVEQLRLPLTIFGNVLGSSRGESVPTEVLGHGDGRLANQRFKLKKKPLTYLHTASGDALAQPVLLIRVDGVEWKRVKSFFGRGPNDKVYIVRHDDAQNTLITFGDGVRGSRLPSGVKNVVASYRFGAGAAAPPANHIRQLAAAVKGLRGVKSPVAAQAGKEADAPEELRANAPRTALLLGRAVSAADFEALTLHAPGVIQARAQWLWIPEQMQAGVVVHYIGEADESTISDSLHAQADPTLPISVDRAEPIEASVAVSVEVDPRYVKETVAEQVQEHLVHGVLHPTQASIGGVFWPGSIYEAAAEIEGVVAVNGLSFTTDSPTLHLGDTAGSCIETGRYLDFSGDDAVTVTGVEAKGLPPLTNKEVA